MEENSHKLINIYNYIFYTQFIIQFIIQHPHTIVLTDTLNIEQYRWTDDVWKKYFEFIYHYKMIDIFSYPLPNKITYNMLWYKNLNILTQIKG